MRLSTACLLLFLSASAAAQTWRLPTDRPNTRFYSDAFAAQGVVRPALSMRGFDNTPGTGRSTHAYSHTTYGVRQVLDLAFGISTGTPEIGTLDLFENIIDRYDDPLCSVGCSDAQIEGNAEILESQAFVALMTFVISLNDGDKAEPDLFPASVLDRVDNLPRLNAGTGQVDHAGTRARPRAMAAAPRPRMPSASEGVSSMAR